VSVMTTKIALFHSVTPGNVPPDGLLTGEIAFNVADGFQFVGYGGDVNFDIYGNILPDLPPPGMGWKTFVVGGGDQPGPPGPGVPTGGQTGQVLTKLSDGDYVTGWVDGVSPASPNVAGVLYGYSAGGFGGNENVALGFQAQNSIGTGQQNVSVGYQAGVNQNNVSDNVVIGYQAGWNIDGDGNVAIGSQALGNQPGGQATGNVAVGFQAGYNLTEGDGNIFIGYESGINVRGGGGNTIIGRAGGSSDLIQNVIISDGYGDIKFWANQAGAWSTDGIDFGTTDFVLTSQGPNLPPAWKELPLGLVSQIIAGDNITISPSIGTGIVTINATGGGGGGGTVTSIRANAGLKVSGGNPNPIVSNGGLEVDFTQVVGTNLYNAPGNIVYGGATTTSPASLPIGTIGQVLVVGPSNTLAWDSIEGASPATPTVYGTVYGSTSNAGSYYGYGAGVGVTGNNNTLIGENAGVQVGTGSDNTFLGSYTGYAGLSGSVAISNGAGAVRFFANSAGAWSLNGDAQFGQAGQVLASQGLSLPPQWVTPVNAPIQTVNDGPGISTSVNGTALTINNTGILSVAGFAPIVATTANGNVSITAPNVLSDVQAGTGITISGTGNSRTISNSGVVSLVNGINTTAIQTSTPGVWQINATGGGGGTIISLQEGAGIDIANPAGPSPTITNSGVLSVTATSPIVASASTGGITLSAPSVLTSLTGGTGITITGTGNSRTITNSGITNVVSGSPGVISVDVTGGVATISSSGGTGVTKINAGTNVTITPSTGIGEVTINATGGGGGGSINEIKAGTGISVQNPTSAAPTVTNTGVLAVAAGSNVSIGGTPANPVINATGTLNNLTAGAGINITNATGPNATIANTGLLDAVGGNGINVSKANGVITITNTQSPSAVASVTGQGAGISVSPVTGAVVVQNTGVTSIAGTTGNITATSSTGGVTLNIGSNVLTSVTAGNSGIVIGGTGNTRTISAAVSGLTAGAGIDISETSGNFTIENTGVLGLTQGTNVTITETTPGSGNFTISSTGGGGGGTGTVTSIATGFGLSGGTITTSGTLTIDQSKVVNINSWNGKKGSLLIGQFSSGFDVLESPADASLNGTFYFLGTSNILGVPQWRTTQILKVSDTDSIKWNSLAFGDGGRTASVPTDWLISNAIPWTTFSDPIGTAGSMVYAERDLPPPFIGSGVGTAILYPGSVGDILTMASGSTINPRKPAWANPSTLPFVSGVSATAPVTVNNANPKTPVIGFDINTTALTSYIPKSAFNATSTLLVGSGVGSYNTLAPGNNGQVLSVASNGALVWVDPAPPVDPINLTPADNTITLTPNPITGTGTIGVTPNTFILQSTLSAKGDMIYADDSALPSRLSIGTSGQIMVVSNTGIPSWVTNLDAGTY
jgi:hypothetical protein